MALTIACGGGTPPHVVAPKHEPRHLQIVHAITTSQQKDLMDKLRERNPSPPDREWTLDEPALNANAEASGPSLAVVDPFARFLRRAKRRIGPVRAKEAPRLDEMGAAAVARRFVGRNADLLGLPRTVIPGLAEHVREPQPIDHASPYATHVIRFDAPFSTKGYEGFHEIDNTADVEVFVDDDGEVSSFVNLSKVHPRLMIDTKPLLSQEDARITSQLVGRTVFALIDDSHQRHEKDSLAPPKTLREVRELRRVPLGTIAPSDVTHVQLVIHVATGPQLAWLTYRLGYFVEIAKPARAELFDGRLAAGPQFFFFRYVVDADSGDVLEDARAPMAPAVIGQP